jgi:hypothetical protein
VAGVEVEAGALLSQLGHDGEVRADAGVLLVEAVLDVLGRRAVGG